MQYSWPSRPPKKITNTVNKMGEILAHAFFLCRLLEKEIVGNTLVQYSWPGKNKNCQQDGSNTRPRIFPVQTCRKRNCWQDHEVLTCTFILCRLVKIEIHKIPTRAFFLRRWTNEDYWQDCEELTCTFFLRTLVENGTCRCRKLKRLARCVKNSPVHFPCADFRKVELVGGKWNWLGRCV